MISISNQTVSTNAAAGTVVGKLTLLDANRVGLSANFILTKGPAGFFGISASNLVMMNTSIPPGFYILCESPRSGPRPGIATRPVSRLR